MKRNLRDRTKRKKPRPKSRSTRRARRRPLNLSPEELALRNSLGSSQNIRRLKRLQNLLILEITRRIEHLRKLPNIDEPLYRAGIEALESEKHLIAWLCEPAPALDNQLPIEQIDTEEGRKRVIQILRAIDYGVYL